MLCREAGFIPHGHTNEAIHVTDIGQQLAFLSGISSQQTSECKITLYKKKYQRGYMQGNPPSMDMYCSTQLEGSLFLLFLRQREEKNGTSMQGSLSLLASPPVN